MVQIKIYPSKHNIESIKTNSVVRGNSKNKVNNIYILTLVKSKETNNLNKCPQCGAPIDINNSGICEYCKSKIVTDTNEWIMSKKEKISQR